MNFDKILRFRRSVPVLRQSTIEECGLACLAMVANFYGYRSDVSELRGAFSHVGSRLSDLLANARSLKLDARPLRLELAELADVKLPAILHWDLDHFVVLVKVRRHKVLVHDPAIGARWYSWHELSGHFSGVVLECSPSSDFVIRRHARKLKLADLWSRSQGLVTFIVQLCLLSLVLQALALAGPFYMQLVVDEGLQRRDHDLISLLAFGFLAFLLIRVLVEGIRSWVAQYVGHRLSFQLNSNLFFHLFRLPMGWYERRNLGDITSRIGSLAPIHTMLTEGFIMFVIDGIMAVLTFALMIWYAFDLTLVVLATLMLFALIKVGLYPQIRQRNEDEILASADQETLVLETLRNMTSVKVFGREAERHQRWQNRYSRVMKASYQQGTLGILTSLGDSLLFGIENILIIYLAAQAVIASEMSIGMLFAFMSYKGQFTDRMTNLIGQLLELRMLSLHLGRLADICFTEPEVGPVPKIMQAPLKGDILIDASTIGYDGSDPILQNVALALPAGSSSLILGPSGAGKTTLMKVMMGLLPVEDGLWIDGIRLSAYGIENYRSCMAAVMQNDSLLSGTVLENVVFFATEPDFEFAEQCLKTVELTEAFKALPMGLHTQIGDLGSVLSSGQYQRLLLARALYAKPTILFLDEAMAHLDMELATRLLSRIGKMTITRIIIDHRPEVIETVDKAFVVQAGTVQELDLESFALTKETR